MPGAELREAFRPVGLAWGSFDLSQSLSLEGFYQYDWDETVIDPPGHLFLHQRLCWAGRNARVSGFGSVPDTGDSPPFVQPPLDRPFLGVPRAPDVEPSDSGQWGAALRWLAGFGNTEFGFYFMNYHSRLPTVNGITGTIQGATGRGRGGGASSRTRLSGSRGAAGCQPRGGCPPLQAAGQAAGTDAYAATARYFIAYPEDIKLWGASFNTQIATTGIAVQGEVSYKQDAPYQVDDVELLFAALSPISPWAGSHQPGGAWRGRLQRGHPRLRGSMPRRPSSR